MDTCEAEHLLIAARARDMTSVGQLNTLVTEEGLEIGHLTFEGINGVIHHKGNGVSYCPTLSVGLAE